MSIPAENIIWQIGDLPTSHYRGNVADKDALLELLSIRYLHEQCLGGFPDDDDLEAVVISIYGGGLSLGEWFYRIEARCEFYCHRDHLAGNFLCEWTLGHQVVEHIVENYELSDVELMLDITGISRTLEAMGFSVWPWD